jgi:hypothetical protein
VGQVCVVVRISAGPVRGKGAYINYANAMFVTFVAVAVACCTLTTRYVRFSRVDSSARSRLRWWCLTSVCTCSKGKVFTCAVLAPYIADLIVWAVLIPRTKQTRALPCQALRSPALIGVCDKQSCFVTASSPRSSRFEGLRQSCHGCRPCVRSEFIGFSPTVCTGVQ